MVSSHVTGIILTCDQKQTTPVAMQQGLFDFYIIFLADYSTVIIFFVRECKSNPMRYFLV